MVSRGRIPTTRWWRRLRRPRRIRLPIRRSSSRTSKAEKDAKSTGATAIRRFDLVEEKVAALERTEDAAAFASGMAAVTSTILALVKSGSHVILFADCYRRTRQFVTTYPRSLRRIEHAHSAGRRGGPEGGDSTRDPIGDCRGAHQSLPNDSRPRAGRRDLPREEGQDAGRQHVRDAREFPTCEVWDRHRRA